MIEIVEGNLLESSCDILVQQVNCQGHMNSGIAKQIRDKWYRVYKEYKETIEFLKLNGIVRDSFDLLGYINWTKIDYFDKYIVNFFSQDQYLPRNICHTDYNAFKLCCEGLKNFIDTTYTANQKANLYIGFPYKIGCGLAGGDWNIVYNIIEEEFKDYNVRIYKYNETRNN